MRQENVLTKADNPPVEIEITPEMIEAGLDAYGWWERRDDAEHFVRQVYTAMEATRLGCVCNIAEEPIGSGS